MRRPIHVVVLGGLLALAATGCASALEPAASVAAPAGPPTEPTAARLTGGAGNHVVGSFDELRTAVAAVQAPIDACWRAAAGEPGWRETVVWELHVDHAGGVDSVHVVPAEYWREGKVVSGAPSAALDRCMTAALLRLAIRAPRESGTVRLRFEPL